MKSFIATALMAASAIAAPLERRQNSTNLDVTVLQFALTLEHLENVFYKQALKNYTLADFEKAGYDATYYNNIKYIAHDEESHVTFLESALKGAGVTPTAACTYKFPSTDVHSFVGLSSVLEGVGTSAYLGGAPLITSKAYLTAAGSILVTEALHTSLQRSATGEVPIANPYGTPLDPTSVYTLAAAFIASCPASNPALPFTPYPALAVAASKKRDAGNWGYGHGGWNHGGYNGGNGGNNGGNNGGEPAAPALPKAGDSVTFTTAKNVPAGSFVTFVSGLSVVSVPGKVSGGSISATVPMEAQGQSYVFVTKANENGTLNGADIIAGPAILEVAPPTPTYDNSIL